MSDIRVLIKRADGGISVLIPADEALQKMSLEEVIAKSVEPGLETIVVSKNDIPSDRRLRNAWEHDGANSVKLNLAKSQELIRERRNRALQKLDSKAFAAGRANDAARLAKIDAEAKRLRDISLDPRFANGSDDQLKDLFDRAKVEIDD